MTAQLAYKIPENFTAASNVSDFYNEDDKKKLEIFAQREQPQPGKPSDGCKTNLFFGFFFDGTKNNYIKAEEGKNHSNVARLYDCYPGLSVPDVLPKSTDWQHNPTRYTHFFKVYVPGVSSPFPQFAALVDDSRIDESLVLLRDRGHDVYRRPSRSHALLAEALCAAAKAGLDERELLGWCEWFWRQDQLSCSDTAEALTAWRNTSL
jgi:hypothetical protein